MINFLFPFSLALILLLVLLQASFFVFFDFLSNGYWGTVFIFFILGILIILEKPNRNLGFFLAFFAGFLIDIFSSFFFGFYITMSMAIAFAVKFILRQYIRRG